MHACHVGRLAWSGVSSAIVRLYNSLCIRVAFALSVPVPTFYTFSWVDSPGAASSLESLKLHALYGSTRLERCREVRSAGTIKKGGVHVRDSKLRKASKPG